MKRLYEEGFTQNRELSWLRFDERVLDEAADLSVPALERLQFIQIFMSNLDEFFMVRVGSLIDMQYTDVSDIDSVSGLTPKKQLKKIYRMVPKLYEKKNHIYASVMAELREHGVIQVSYSELTENEREYVRAKFRNQIRNILKPRIIHEGESLPHMANKSQAVIASLPTESGRQYGLVEIPSEVEPILILSVMENGIRYIRTEEVIVELLGWFFQPFEVEEKVLFRITRNSEFKESDESSDLSSNARQMMKELLRSRGLQAVDRLEVEGHPSEEMKEFLLSQMEISPYQWMESASPISIRYIKELRKQIPSSVLEPLTYTPFKPVDQFSPFDEPIIDRVRAKDIFSAYPYDSMYPMLELLKEAAVHPDVTQIRMTIYRLADHAKIADYLIQAAENGKKVRVIIELRARFDEQNNIDWSEKLEKAGCKVYYGSEGPDDYKVHCKVCQIVMKEGDSKRYITQVGTGNYNESTSAQYTDFSLITSNQLIGKSVSKFFKNVAKNRLEEHYKYIVAAPADFKKQMLTLIERETRKKDKGKIFIKINSLTDTDIIDALSTASNAGVRIRMIVRGICCILPGVPNCTENIEVVNVVGRFLEHSRVYVFGSKKDEVMYIASADLMTRNTENRVELAFPIYSRKIRREIKHILLLNFRDNVKGRQMDSKGKYRKKPAGKASIDSQAILMKEALERSR